MRFMNFHDILGFFKEFFSRKFHEFSEILMPFFIIKFSDPQFLGEGDFKSILEIFLKKKNCGFWLKKLRKN